MPGHEYLCFRCLSEILSHLRGRLTHYREPGIISFDKTESHCLTHSLILTFRQASFYLACEFAARGIQVQSGQVVHEHSRPLETEMEELFHLSIEVFGFFLGLGLFVQDSR